MVVLRAVRSASSVSIAPMRGSTSRATGRASSANMR
jgi:hypothetical protein